MMNLCSKCEPYETEYIEKCKKGNCMYKKDWDSKFGIIDDRKVIDGVGKDAPTVTNARGGKQAASPMAMHLVDPDYLKEFYENERDEKESEVLDCDEEFNQKVRQAIMYIAEFMKNEEPYILLVAMDELAKKEEQIIKVAKTLQEGVTEGNNGKGYPTNNWRLIPQEEHINHALIHLIAHLAGDKQDNHIEHALTRLMMAYATEKSEDFSYTECLTELHEGM